MSSYALSTWKSLKPDEQRQCLTVVSQIWFHKNMLRGDAAQLLEPEWRSGLISDRDYAYVSTFLGERMRKWHYFMLWDWPSFVTAGLIAHSQKKKHGGLAAQAFISSTSFLFTFLGTHTFLSAKLVNLWVDAENPLGVANAIRTMRSRVERGSVKHGAPLNDVDDPRMPPPPPPPADFAPDSVQEESPSNPGPLPTSTSPQKPESSESDQPSSGPTSRWDEIRSASRGKASNSTWDEIRQKHEHPEVRKTKSEEERWRDRS